MAAKAMCAAEPPAHTQSADKFVAYVALLLRFVVRAGAAYTALEALGLVYAEIRAAMDGTSVDAPAAGALLILDVLDHHHGCPPEGECMIYSKQDPSSSAPAAVSRGMHVLQG